MIYHAKIWGANGQYLRVHDYRIHTQIADNCTLVDDINLATPLLRPPPKYRDMGLQAIPVVIIHEVRKC